MKHLKLNYLLTTLALATTLASCHKDKEVVKNTTPLVTSVYVLNQGNFGKSNSSLTFYDKSTSTTTADIFTSANSRGLGATANDAKIYGTKMYITVDLSGTVEVVDAKTAKSIKQVLFQNSDKSSREPRSVAFANGKVFISLYDGQVGKVAVMDTTTYTVSQYINVGVDPEGMTVVNNKLYVANSGGINYPNVDKTVSVIDLATLSKTKDITVGQDPYGVSSDAYGHVFVVAYGVFGTSNASLTVIDSSSDTVLSTKDFTGGPLAIAGDNGYYIDGDGTIKIYNVKTLTAGTTNFIADATVLKAGYAINVLASTGEVFVTDAVDYSSNGTLYAFDKTGKKEYSFTTGVNPGTITFVSK